VHSHHASQTDGLQKAQAIKQDEVKDPKAAQEEETLREEEARQEEVTVTHTTRNARIKKNNAVTIAPISGITEQIGDG